MARGLGQERPKRVPPTGHSHRGSQRAGARTLPQPLRQETRRAALLRDHPPHSPQEEAPDGPGEHQDGAEGPALGDVEGQGQGERVGVILDHDEQFRGRYGCHQPGLLAQLLVGLPAGAAAGSASPAPQPSRVIHEVVDLTHGHATHVHEEDEPQEDQVVLRGHPQHKLQVERVQFRQQELAGGGVSTSSARDPCPPRHHEAARPYHQDDATNGQPATQAGGRLPLKANPASRQPEHSSPPNPVLHHCQPCSCSPGHTLRHQTSSAPAHLATPYAIRPALLLLTWPQPTPSDQLCSCSPGLTLGHQTSSALVTQPHPTPSDQHCSWSLSLTLRHQTSSALVTQPHPTPSDQHCSWSLSLTLRHQTSSAPGHSASPYAIRPALFLVTQPHPMPSDQLCPGHSASPYAIRPALPWSLSLTLRHQTSSALGHSASPYAIRPALFLVTQPHPTPSDQLCPGHSASPYAIRPALLLVTQPHPTPSDQHCLVTQPHLTPSDQHCSCSPGHTLCHQTSSALGHSASPYAIRPALRLVTQLHPTPSDQLCPGHLATPYAIRPALPWSLSCCLAAC
ncbi:hypothetical protein P7K49_040264 [Saguinus oedipus]|uniref:Uncharacterized protein n=1 Tax=Saguinus oedipus TaxID=9490 RepID=A0ABQ9T8S1_SAGOE|nr:hypothetical protein P7K49_040264 [Saguinus oedipus]